MSSVPYIFHEPETLKEIKEIEDKLQNRDFEKLYRKEYNLLLSYHEYSDEDKGVSFAKKLIETMGDKFFEKYADCFSEPNYFGARTPTNKEVKLVFATHILGQQNKETMRADNEAYICALEQGLSAVDNTNLASTSLAREFFKLGKEYATWHRDTRIKPNEGNVRYAEWDKARKDNATKNAGEIRYQYAQAKNHIEELQEVAGWVRDGLLIDNNETEKILSAMQKHIQKVVNNDFKEGESREFKLNLPTPKKPFWKSIFGKRKEKDKQDWINATIKTFNDRVASLASNPIAIEGFKRYGGNVLEQDALSKIKKLYREATNDHIEAQEESKSDDKVLYDTNKPERMQQNIEEKLSIVRDKVIVKPAQARMAELTEVPAGEKHGITKIGQLRGTMPQEQKRVTTQTTITPNNQRPSKSY